MTVANNQFVVEKSSPGHIVPMTEFPFITQLVEITLQPENIVLLINIKKISEK